MVKLHHRRGGVKGIYRCEIPDAMNIIQTMYIRLYSADTDGEYGHYASQQQTQKLQAIVDWGYLYNGVHVALTVF